MGIVHSILGSFWWWLAQQSQTSSPSKRIQPMDLSQLPKDLYDEYVVDLHDLVVLLNYERSRRDPHFDHTKLQEVTSDTFETTKLSSKAQKKWSNMDPSHRLGIVFGTRPDTSEDYEDDLELPTNILKPPVPPSLTDLTARQQESIYWRSRNHGGSDTTTDLLECLFETWPEPSPLLRVRIPPSGNKPSKEYLASPYYRQAVEFTLVNPTEATFTVTPKKTFVRNATKGDVAYSVIGFSPLNSANPLASRTKPVDTILDLSSMQHGDIGRGLGGEDTFIIARAEDYVRDYLPKFAASNTFGQATYNRMARKLPRTGPWDEEMLDIVHNVRTYWKYKHKRTFCAFCGVPEGFRGDGEPLIPCSRCNADFYCSKAHKKSAWVYHQHFCSPIS